jgi:hypothetical protein
VTAAALFVVAQLGSLWLMGQFCSNGFHAPTDTTDAA